MAYFYLRARLPTKKSDLLSHLDTGILSQPPHQFHAKVFDGAAIIHAFSTKQAVTFDRYCNKVFLP